MTKDELVAKLRDIEWEDFEVKAPQTVRIDTVRPPYIGVVGRDTFPIIHEIHRVARTVDNAVVLAEHQ